MGRTFFSFVFSVPSSFCAFLACRFSVFAVNCRRGGQDCVLVLRVHMDTDLELEESLWRLSVRRLWSRRMCSLSRLLIVVGWRKWQDAAAPASKGRYALRARSLPEW